jgi:predicted O-methyltransferase YrrM
MGIGIEAERPWFVLIMIGGIVVLMASALIAEVAHNVGRIRRRVLRVVARLAEVRPIAIQLERRALARINRLPCPRVPLTRSLDGRQLSAIFRDPRIAAELQAKVEPRIAALGITDKAGGVNPGDRWAIYHLIRALRPATVLEVGTHIGASTVYTAAALMANQAEDPARDYRLTTVDVKNVNEPDARPWIKLGSTYSPKELVDRIGATHYVRFVTAPSLSYLGSTGERFDFVFLDGDHGAPAVYQEIAAALRALNDGGLILLHDYFPGNRPLWPDGAVIPGPWIGAKRLQDEGVPLQVLPLGALPWETKQGSRVTSLAVTVGR